MVGVVWTCGKFTLFSGRLCLILLCIASYYCSLVIRARTGRKVLGDEVDLARVWTPPSLTLYRYQKVASFPVSTPQLIFTYVRKKLGSRDWERG